jgi:hypothetical protein
MKKVLSEIMFEQYQKMLNASRTREKKNPAKQ